MFIFLVQLLDFVVLGAVGLFLVFYITSWVVLGVRLWNSSKYRNTKKIEGWKGKISVILPVYNEGVEVFARCLESVVKETEGFDREIFVIENGPRKCVVKDGVVVNAYEDIAKENGATYVYLEEASKRKAIAEGVKMATGEIAVLLDSDSIATPYSIENVLEHFADPNVGGVVPRQAIFNAKRGVMRRMCDWYEDIRFGNTTPGLSYHGTIPCLIGRLYAVRMEILRRYMQEFVDQKILGLRMETGDDRVITSYVIEEGYRTVYDEDALIYTDAPSTLWGFAKQRLRWSRSSFRETIMTSKWLWKHPYAFFIMWADIVMRWFFFVVMAVFAWKLWTGDLSPHVLDIPLWVYVVGGAIGFFVSGWLKQIPHLMRKPEDFWYTPIFLLLTTFVLTPVEWYGNLTCLEQGWLTRKGSDKI